MFHEYNPNGPNGEILVLRDTQDLTGRKAIFSRTGKPKPRNTKNRILMKKAKWPRRSTFNPSQTSKKPKKPKNLTISPTPGNGSMTISYTAPDQGSSPITSYTWQYSLDNGSSWATLRTNTTDNPITFTGLTNGTVYSFKTQAINNVGNGPWSNSVSAAPFAVPDKVQNLRATSKNKAVDLSWDTPNNNGKPITSYEYEQTVGDTTVTVDLESTLTTHTISGLVNGQTYSFKMRAINAGWSSGNGPWSDAVSACPTEISYPAYKSWRIYMNLNSNRIRKEKFPYTCGIRFFNEKNVLLELDLKKIFSSSRGDHPVWTIDGGTGGLDNWAKHQPGNFDPNWSRAEPIGASGTGVFHGFHSETTQMISKIHIGSTVPVYVGKFDWGSLLGGRNFVPFYIQGSNDANIQQTGAVGSDPMSGSWITIMTVTEEDLYEPSPITDTSSTATKGGKVSYFGRHGQPSGVQQMRIIDIRDDEGGERPDEGGERPDEGGGGGGGAPA
jgi:hypothetical protein